MVGCVVNLQEVASNASGAASAADSVILSPINPNQTQSTSSTGILAKTSDIKIKKGVPNTRAPQLPNLLGG